MNATYWQKGETLDYTATTAVQSGQVVSLNTRIGVAGTDIPAGDAGAVHVVGVFELSKDAAAITLGATVYYDTTTDVITETAAGNIPAGYAVAPADASASVVLVKLLG